MVKGKIAAVYIKGLKLLNHRLQCAWIGHILKTNFMKSKLKENSIKF